MPSHVFRKPKKRENLERRQGKKANFTFKGTCLQISCKRKGQREIFKMLKEKSTNPESYIYGETIFQK